MEENKNHNNQMGQSSKPAPILSKRGQYNPNLKQGNGNATLQSNAEMQQPHTYQAPPQYNNQASGIPGSTQPTMPQYNQPPHTPAAMKHSGVGIASFVIAIVSIISAILSIVLVFTGVLNMVTDNNLDIDTFADPDAVNNMLLSGELGSGMSSLIFGSLLLFFSLGISFVGGILGLIAAFQKNRKKVFGILGLIFNGLVCVGFIFMLVLGLVGSV